MNTLHKSERLTNKTLFEELLSSNFSFIQYPFRMIAKESSRTGDYPARIAISVSKKKFKHAVDRNRLKRLTREAFRCNKNLLYNAVVPGKTIDILFVYLDTRIASFPKVEKALQSALAKTAQHFTNLPAHEQTAKG